MPIDVSSVQPLLQRALDLMELASTWEREAAKKAHICGLQGEKRRLRYLYRKASNIVDWIEHKSADILRIDIRAQKGIVDTSTLKDPKSAMEGIITKLWTIYFETHQLANELVAIRFNKFAKPLYKYSDRLFDILGELQRAQMEYEMAKYEYHHISRYQLGWDNVHDKYKHKERKQGYKSIV